MNNPSFLRKTLPESTAKSLFFADFTEILDMPALTVKNGKSGENWFQVLIHFTRAFMEGESPKGGLWPAARTTGLSGERDRPPGMRESPAHFSGWPLLYSQSTFDSSDASRARCCSWGFACPRLARTERRRGWWIRHVHGQPRADGRGSGAAGRRRPGNCPAARRQAVHCSHRGVFNARPAAASNRLLLRSDKFLYGVGAKSKERIKACCES